MSTRSWIGIELEDSSIKAIYCHHDGYLSHNGVILNKHYTDRNKVEALIELGAISSLDADEADDYFSRGEEKTWECFPSLDDFWSAQKNSIHIEYAYLYTLNNKWLLVKDNRVEELERALKEMEEKQ